LSNFDKVRSANAAGHRDAAARELTTHSVFLAGPYIKIDSPAEDADNSGSPSKSLRFYLYQFLTASAHRVYLGEDVKLRTLGEANYGSSSNAVIFERHYIKNHTDAVIALPSSPGSFCEFGDWAPDREICRKMLVVIDSAYRDVTNYINDGAVRFSRMNGATIEYIDYRDKDGVAGEVEKFLEFIGSSQRIEQLYGRR
jgi:hypothetical protein